jgi:DNA-binding GntR family transcriptional regulator
MDGYGQALAALAAIVLLVVDVVRRRWARQREASDAIKDRHDELMDAIRNRDVSGVNRALNERLPNGEE